MDAKLYPFQDADLLALYDEQLRVQVEYPDARKEVTRDVVRFTRQAPAMNFVTYTLAGEADYERAIQEQLKHFLPLGQPFTWKLHEHDRLPGLKERLVAHGFILDEEDPGDMMILDVREMPPHLAEPVRADIRRIPDRAGLRDVVQVLDGVYGNQNTWVYDRLGGHLEIPGYLSVYVAYVQDQPAAVAWTYFPEGQFATLFAGSTLEVHRKQGLYTSLLAVRLQEIRERGRPYAIVEAGAMSKPIVSRHGFQHLTTQYDYEWKGSPTPDTQRPQA